MERATQPENSGLNKLKRSCCCQVRLLQILLLFLIEACCYAMRANLSVALVQIVTTTNSEIVNGTTILRKPYAWTSNQQGVILSSFFWLYSISQLFGGLLSFKYGSKSVILFSTLGTALLSILSPLSVYIGGFYAFLIIRSMKGCLEGLFYPSMIQFISKWVPVMERTRVVSICLCGASFGTVVSLYLSGVIASVWSWEAIFYVFGIISAFCGILFLLLATETPEKHPFISQDEIEFIKITRKRSVDLEMKLSKVPVRRMLGSKPVWAIVLGIFTMNYNYYFILTELPSYLMYKFQLDIKNIGMLSSLPYIASLVMMFATGYLSDYLRQSDYMKVTNIRKCACIIGLIGQATLFIFVAMTSDSTTSIVCLVLSMGFGGITLPSIDSNILDLSPTYASFTMIISNSVGTIGSILAPIITGSIVSEGPAHWRDTFFVPFALNVFSSIIIFIFCSAKTQNWDGS